MWCPSRSDCRDPGICWSSRKVPVPVPSFAGSSRVRALQSAQKRRHRRLVKTRPHPVSVLRRAFICILRGQCTRAKSRPTCTRNVYIIQNIYRIANRMTRPCLMRPVYGPIKSRRSHNCPAIGDTRCRMRNLKFFARSQSRERDTGGFLISITIRRPYNMGCNMRQEPERSCRLSAARRIVRTRRRRRNT